MPDCNIIIYGADWCWDCRRARKYFNDHKISYQWINVDHDIRAEQFVLQINQGMRSIPTIVFQDGSILVEPSNAQLAEKLNILLT
jgi:glutaredoxin-like protein